MMGALELLAIFVVFLFIPMMALRIVARARGQSPNHFMLWGLFSYLGLIVGLLVMIAMPARAADKPSSKRDIF